MKIKGAHSAPFLRYSLTIIDYCDSIDYRNSPKGEKLMKLFDSELKAMEIIWDNEPISAKEVSLIANEQIGWNKNTTYTVLKKLEAKGYINRGEPNFICTSIIKREQAQLQETKTLIDKLFGGSKRALFSALISDENLSDEEIDEIRKMIEER